MHIILASSSPRRKQILSEIYTVFTSEPVDIDEEKTLLEYLNNIAEIRKNNRCTHPAQFLAIRKLEAAAQKMIQIRAETLIIAADTMVEFGEQILNKPVDRADAERMLRLLSGNTHRVCTGMALRFFSGKDYHTASGYEVTYVKFRTLSDEQIMGYLETGEWEDKAGAYGIQGVAGHFAEHYEGDFLNVVGFPKQLFSKLLKELPVNRLTDFP